MQQGRRKDTSKISDLTTIAPEVIPLQKEIEDLRKVIIRQTLLVTQLKGSITQKDEEINHLKSMLEKTVPIIHTDSIEINEEEIICLKQIEFLKNEAVKRQLTLDEIRMLDLLIKNKRLSQGKPTENTRNLLPIKDVTPLLDIARHKPTKDPDDGN